MQSKLDAVSSDAALEESVEGRAARLARHVRGAHAELAAFIINKDGFDKPPLVSSLPSSSKNMYIDSFDLMHYWTEPSRAARYPNLQPIVVRALVCKLCSTSVERVRATANARFALCFTIHCCYCFSRVIQMFSTATQQAGLHMKPTMMARRMFLKVF